MKLNINIAKLITVKHFAMNNKVTTAYIYKLMTEGKIKPVEIDGVKFVDLAINPKLHSK
jgi:hypothetical protein